VRQVSDRLEVVVEEVVEVETRCDGLAGARLLYQIVPIATVLEENLELSKVLLVLRVGVDPRTVENTVCPVHVHRGRTRPDGRRRPRRWRRREERPSRRARPARRTTGGRTRDHRPSRSSSLVHRGVPVPAVPRGNVQRLPAPVFERTHRLTERVVLDSATELLQRTELLVIEFVEELLVVDDGGWATEMGEDRSNIADACPRIAVRRPQQSEVRADGLVVGESRPAVKGMSAASNADSRGRDTPRHCP